MKKFENWLSTRILEANAPSFNKGDYVKLKDWALRDYKQFYHSLTKDTVGVIVDGIVMPPDPKVLPQYRRPKIKVIFPELSNIGGGIKTDIFVDSLEKTDKVPGRAKTAAEERAEFWPRIFKMKTEMFSKETLALIAPNMSFEDFLRTLAEHYGDPNTWRTSGPHGYFDESELLAADGRKIAGPTIGGGEFERLRNLALKATQR